jgi:hypothetical protein
MSFAEIGALLESWPLGCSVLAGLVESLHVISDGWHFSVGSLGSRRIVWECKWWQKLMNGVLHGVIGLVLCHAKSDQG